MEGPGTRRAVPGLCRDCLGWPIEPARGRCSACGSPRVTAHEELAALAIAHIDCDAFFAAIEKRDNPELADKPVIVGGSSRRGVVSTACYVARTFGVRSAMPMFKALEACPDAIVIRPNIEKYSRIGREIRAMMRDLTPLVEPVSIDEAFLDLSGTEKLHGGPPALTLARFARRVEAELNLTDSDGQSCNKFLANIASDLDKPRGFAVIGRAEAPAFLATKPIGIIPGVGRVTQERLARDGLRRIADVQRLSDADLARRFGEEGLRLARLARGEDRRRVEPEHETKSISAETTFDTDIADPAALAPILLRLSEKVAVRLRRAELAGCSVTLKLKTPDFQIRTRARSGLAPTQLAGRIYDTARDLLAREPAGTAYRLIGVGVADFRPAADADLGDLVDTGAVRQATMEKAIDRLREKFGGDAVVRGLVFGAKKRD
jgi:DNA polymerase-4